MHAGPFGLCVGCFLPVDTWCFLFLRSSCLSSPVPGWTGLKERTFVAVKPDGVQRKQLGEIVRRFERKGFKLVGLKLMQVSRPLFALLDIHYQQQFVFKITNIFLLL